MSDQPMTLQEMFDYARDASAATFDKFGKHMPTFWAQDDEGHMVPMFAPWVDDASQAAAMSMVRQTLTHMKCRRVIFVMEAWVASTKASHAEIEALGLRARNLPNKQWVIYVAGESTMPGEAPITGHWLVDQKAGSPKIGSWVVIPATHAEGMLANLLPAPPGRRN